MIFGVLRLLNGIPKASTPASEVKPTTGPVVGTAILVTSVVVIGVMMVNGLNNGMLIACIVGFSALILGSLFVRGVYGELHKQDQIRTLPAPPRQEYTATQLRERASLITVTPRVVIPEAPRAREATLPPRVVMTYKQVQADRELDERMLRIAAIIVARCPACNAGEAEFCTFLPDEPTYLLDRDRTIVAHGKRIGNAVKTHTAKVTEVVAQFNGHVPDDVWQAAL